MKYHALFVIFEKKMVRFEIFVCYKLLVALYGLSSQKCQDILTSTKNASLIITDFLAMIYKNEQPRTAILCRGWAMLENDINLICR